MRKDGSAMMVYIHEEYRFEKRPDAHVVHVYHKGKEIDFYACYGIGRDYDALEMTCNTWLENSV